MFRVLSFVLLNALQPEAETKRPAYYDDQRPSDVRVVLKTPAV
jgi:hypothetical protein